MSERLPAVTLRKASLQRLYLYRAVALRLRSYGQEWICSEDIATSLGIRSSQVRKDFFYSAITGKRKVGYNIAELVASIDKALGRTDSHEAIVVGVGGLGRSLLKDKAFGRHHIKIIAAFDEHPTDEPLGVPVYPMSELVSFITNRQIRFAVLASSPEKAQHLADLMFLAGVLGVLCLAPVKLRAPGNRIASTIDFGNELERVVFFATHRLRGKAGKV